MCRSDVLEKENRAELARNKLAQLEEELEDANLAKMAATRKLTVNMHRFFTSPF
jgi:hypothetical protein